MNESPTTTDATTPIRTPANNPQAEAIAVAVDNALPASLKGRAQMFAATAVGSVILLAVQHFQPRYFPWLTPDMASTAAGLLGIGTMLAIHEITRSAVFTRLKQSFSDHNGQLDSTNQQHQP